MDMEGSVCKIAPGTQEKLDRFRKRIADAQRVISRFKSRWKHKYRNYRAYVRAKREFACATACQNNIIKDLHRKACYYLVNRDDAIILPRFSTPELLRSSKAQNHKFNEHLLSLKHFQFRELLRAKCARTGMALIICSEMYTNKTCGRCNSLHLTLGSNPVSQCPHCEFTASRDVNAAYNILRFDCGGSLAIKQ